MTSFDPQAIETMQVEFCECPACRGEGIVREPYVGTMYWQVTCERCGGTGEIERED